MLIAIIVVCLVLWYLGGGYYNPNLNPGYTGPNYGPHISIGMVILIFVVCWFFLNPAYGHSWRSW